MSEFVLNFKPRLYFEINRPKGDSFRARAWWKYVIQAVLHTIRCEKQSHLWQKASQIGQDIVYDIVKNGEDKRRREDDWKNEIKSLKEENKTLRKVVKAMLQPVVRNEIGSDNISEHMELVSIDDGFTSIDDRFDKIYYGSKIQFEDPTDDVKVDKLKNDKIGVLTSPYEPKPARIIINSIKTPPKIATYKPFKRDPLKNPNYLEQEGIRKQERIKEKNQKIMAKAERLMFLDAQSRAEEESLASRSASSGPVIRLKVYNFSAIMLSIKDFIDVRNAIGVNLNVNIGTHNFVLKSILTGNTVDFVDGMEMDISLHEYNMDLNISIDADVVSKSGSTKHLGGGKAALRSLIPEFNVDFGPLVMDLHPQHDVPHARSHANSITARVSMSSKIIGTVGLNDAATIAKKSSRVEKVFPRPQKSALESQGYHTDSVTSDLLSVSSSIGGSQPYIQLPPLQHAGSGASAESTLPSSYYVKVSDYVEPKRSRSNQGHGHGVVDVQKKKSLKWARALDDGMQDDSISVLTMDDSVELKLTTSRSYNVAAAGESASTSSPSSRDRPTRGSSSNKTTSAFFPELLPSSSSPSSGASVRSRSVSPLRFDEGESNCSSNRKQQRQRPTRSKASTSLSIGDDRNKDTDSINTAIVAHRQVRPEQAEELPANEQKALQVIMDVRKCQKKGKKFENRPLTKVEVNLLHSPFAVPVRLLKDSSLSSIGTARETITTTTSTTALTTSTKKPSIRSAN